MNPTLTSASSLYSIAGLIAVAIFNSWTSRINQFFFFSHTAWAGFEQTAQAKQIVLNYKARVWLALMPALLAYVAMQTLVHFSAVTGLFVALLVQAVCSAIAFALAHKAAGNALQQMQPPAEEQARADAGTSVSVALASSQELTKGGTVLLLAAPVSAAAVWVGVLVHERMNSGQLMSAIERQKGDFMNGLGLGLIFASLLIYVLIRYFSRNRTAMGRFTANGAVWTAWMGAAALIGSTLTVPFQLVVTREIRLGVLIAVLLFGALRLVYVWSKARMFPPPQVERNGDEYWRWGLFYCNPSDPTLFIQHRSSPGYTVNFANFISWPLTLFFVADLVFLAVLSAYR